MTSVHRLRGALREGLANGQRLFGTFVKIAAPDIVELAARSELDFIVVDLEHSTLTEAEAIGLVRHADVCRLPALVRVPEVDAPLIARLLENGAAGIQLSTLRSADEAKRLRNAARFAPEGTRSVSLANRVAQFGAISLSDFLAEEAHNPPLLVGQIETRVDERLTVVVQDLDVAFVGTTDLAVSLGMPSRDELADAVAGVRDAAAAAGVAFGGWVSRRSEVVSLGLAEARYIVVGSDLQLLGRSLRGINNEEDI